MPHQQSDSDNLQGHDDDGVRVIPQKIGDNSRDDTHRNTASQAKYLQSQHRKDTAKQEVDVEKDRILEVVAHQAQRSEG